MERLILRPELPAQFLDERGRRWVKDDRRLPGSQREGTYEKLFPDRCECCGLLLGDVVYMRQATLGEVVGSCCVVIEEASAKE